MEDQTWRPSEINLSFMFHPLITYHVAPIIILHVSMSTIKYSVVVPAYKEVGNLGKLITEVFEALAKYNMDKNTEMIIVDDNSADGSEDVVNSMGKKGYNARIIVRKDEKGLSGAVLRGFAESKGEYLLCMDADLQHPPSKVPELFLALKEDVEFAIGTRYGVDGGIDKDWPLHRHVISKGARLLARPLTPLSDPMTGFFSITRTAYKRAKNVSDLGFKICLEMYVKSGIKKHAEVSIVFGVREFGESKLSSKVILHYLKHLWQLYSHEYGLFFYLLLVVILWLSLRAIRRVFH